MKRIKLTVAYDGTNYHGWQFQPEQKTIEGEINKALSELLKTDIEVIGASRTDTGVHAMGNVCVFDAEANIPADKYSFALNTKLPEDIRIVESKEVNPKFHPRYDCHEKTYEYRIVRGRFLSPTKRLYGAHISYKLDVTAMQKATSHFIGTHDFKAFCAAGSTVPTTVRTIYSLIVLEEGDDIVISVTGDGFLYNMVRIIAGTLINVGTGKIKPEECAAIIKSKNRANAGPTAPACGLTLVEIYYDEEE